MFVWGGVFGWVCLPQLAMTAGWYLNCYLELIDGDCSPFHTADTLRQICLLDVSAKRHGPASVAHKSSLF